MTLLAEIRDGALDSKTPLADLLRKCKVLAARLKHQEFADWVNHELNGYPKSAKVPAYRQLKTPVSIGDFVGPFGSAAKNMTIPVTDLAEKVRDMLLTFPLQEPAAQLDELAAKAEKGLQLPWTAEVVRYVATNHPMLKDMHLVHAHREVSAGAIRGVVDVIRTRILDFVIAIESADPSAGETPLDKPAPIPASSVTNVFNTTIIGGQAIVGNSGDATITGNVAKGTQAAGDVNEPSDLLPLLQELRQEAERVPDAEDREEALGVVQQMEKHASAPREKFSVDKMQKYLTLYSTVVTTASNTIPQLEHGLQVLRHMLGV